VLERALKVHARYQEREFGADAAHRSFAGKSQRVFSWKHKMGGNDTQDGLKLTDRGCLCSSLSAGAKSERDIISPDVTHGGGIAVLKKGKDLLIAPFPVLSMARGQ